MKPGIYPGTSMADYLEIPAASASLIKTMVDECPAAAWYVSYLNPNRVRKTTDTMDNGSIAHELLLVGSTDCCVVIDPNNYPAKTSGNIPKGFTNDSIKAARDLVLAAGKIPVLPCDMVAINGMVDSARTFLNSDELRKEEPAIWAAFQPGGGDSEITCVWDDGGTLCRMRPDRISKDRGVIIDPKFTKRAAEPDSFGRTQFGPMGYRISAAFYRRGSEILFGTSPDYVFLVVEQEPPHLCSLVGVDPAGFELGADQVETGLRQWRQCVKTGRWPAYPTRVCYPELAPWETARWEAKEVLSLDERLELASQA